TTHPATLAIYTLSYTTLFRSRQRLQLAETFESAVRNVCVFENSRQRLFPEHVALGGFFHFRARGVSNQRVPGADVEINVRQRLRSEEHTSELQSLRHLVCRLL